MAFKYDFSTKKAGNVEEKFSNITKIALPLLMNTNTTHPTSNNGQATLNIRHTTSNNGQPILNKP